MSPLTIERFSKKDDGGNWGTRKNIFLRIISNTLLICLFLTSSNVYSLSAELLLLSSRSLTTVERLWKFLKMMLSVKTYKNDPFQVARESTTTPRSCQFHTYSRASFVFCNWFFEFHLRGRRRLPHTGAHSNEPEEDRFDWVRGYNAGEWMFKCIWNENETSGRN